jgi:hypothetical protein
MLHDVAHDASSCTRPIHRQPFKNRAEAGAWMGEHLEIGSHGLRYIIPAQGRLELEYCELELDGAPPQLV